ncbi:F-box protein PP2-A13 [Hibiscus syriacus]|uniref:F-box protein PP2-A13 n=1 Tax=Hibiscus syriacus TaxID=106335 RepID=A0A6A3C2H8_HIBSY|nr:F-box protein PP2-A13 [Hibiscus syriacus]
MGANISGYVVDRDEGGSPLKPRLGDIPEGCAALVLALLEPPEICKLARVNRSFHGASSADFIWESKLPSSYKFIMEEVIRDTTLLNLQKKEFYGRLCRPNPFDAGTKTRISTEDSSPRYLTVAYLQQIWWFEVDGEVEFRFPAGTYSLFFRLQLGKSSKRLGRRVCNSEHIHGWEIKPVRFRLTTSDGQRGESQCYLDNPGNWSSIK